MVLLRTKIKFILPVAVVLAVVLVYFLAVVSGYFSQMEGISVVYFVNSGEAEEETLPPVTRVAEEDLAGAPILKEMLEAALEHEFLLYADGVVLDAGLSSYWITLHDDSIRVFIGMSPGDLAEFRDWYSENLDSSYIEYREKIFAIGFWIA